MKPIPAIKYSIQRMTLYIPPMIIGSAFIFGVNYETAEFYKQQNRWP